MKEITRGLLIFISFVGCFSVFKKKVRPTDLLFLFLLIVLHYISRITHPATALYHEKAFQMFVLEAIPLYLVGLTFSKKTSINIFVVLGVLAVLLQFMFLSIKGLGVTNEGDEQLELMGAAYALLPFTIFLFWNVFERRTILNFAMVILASFLQMSMGTRGPVVCLAFFIGVYLFLFKAKDFSIVVKVLVGICVVMLYVFSDALVWFFMLFAVKLGFSDRVFTSLIGDTLLSAESSSGRDFLYETILDYIKKNDLKWGEGLYYDRVITGGDFYAHNLELEVLCEFGYIGGSILLFLFFYFIYRAFRSTWGTKMTIILLIFFCSSIMQLQFSGSYIGTPVFYLFIGMCVSSLREGIHNKQIAVT